MGIRRPVRRRIGIRSPKPELGDRKRLSKKIIITVWVAFLVVITISIVVGLYFSTWRDLWRPIVTVNGETINMDYLIRRMKYVDRTDDVIMMVYELIPYEMLIRQGASRYGIEV